MMGYMLHHTIVVTGQHVPVVTAHALAIGTFPPKVVSGIVQGITNGYESFFVGVDGSKEGWDTSNEFDQARLVFLAQLRFMDVEFVEVQFGGDEPWNNTRVLRHDGEEVDIPFDEFLAGEER